MTDPYTSLKGVRSFDNIDVTNQVQQSMIMFFDFGFLGIGGFNNVVLGVTDINSHDRSKLRLVDDPNYPSGQVWETFAHNLVWESGLNTAVQPTQISGVYINGSFKTTTTSGYEHYVDYPRGRVVFNSPQTPVSGIQMEYAYKIVNFDRITKFPYTQNMQFNRDLFGPTYNSASSGDWSSLVRSQVPLVAVEASATTRYTPLSLGTGAHNVFTDILMHVFDSDDSNVNKLLSFISVQKEKTIWMLDIDLMAQSGAFPLDYNGAKTSSPKTYADLVNGGYRSKKLYLDDAVSSGAEWIDAVYHGVVTFTTETIVVV